ncbi:MAG: rod shape-determining protein MreC [Clostridia bacterium]|nr:rod shape-determining protein MreC [Clostridia bacterium]
MYKKKANSGLIGIIITIIILIVLIILSNIKLEKWSYIGNTFSSLIMPVQNGLTYIKNKIAGNDTFFSNINELKTENEDLKKKNSDLERQVRELEIVKAENESLKEYVNLKDKYSEYTTLPANVIQRDLGNFGKVIVINVGKKDGIDVDMTVIADKGLVGHVISVTENTAKVQTIIDTSSAVSSIIKTTRDGIIVRGTLDSDSLLKGTYIPTDANIMEGDNLETSGIGGIYPKGIHIGTVKQVINTKNITDRYANIETAVNFSKLDTVLVITNK